MTSFVLDSNDLYVACSFKTRKAANFPRKLHVYRLKNKVKDYMVMDDDWDATSYIIDPKSTTGYNSLIINSSTVDIHMLLEDLCRSRLRTNRLGYCFYEIPQMGAVAARTATTSSTDSADNFKYYRMNDLWNWSSYGVVATDPNNEVISPMRWDRLDILRGTPLNFNDEEINKQEYAKVKNDLELVGQLTRSLVKKNEELDSWIKQVKELERRLQGAGTIGSTWSSTIHRPFWASIGNLTSSPVPPSAFNIHYVISYDVAESDQYLRSYRCALDKSIPMFLPVTKFDNDVFTIFVKTTRNPEYNFDTNHWYRITTMGDRDSYLLVYLGSRYHMMIGSSVVQTPLDPNTPHYYSNNPKLDTGFRPFFRLYPVDLDNVGVRICIRLNVIDNMLEKLGSTPEKEEVGQCGIL